MAGRIRPGFIKRKGDFMLCRLGFHKWELEKDVEKDHILKVKWYKCKRCDERKVIEAKVL